MQSRGRVLLIDDEPLVLEMYENIFKQGHYDVTPVLTSRDAVCHLDDEPFDVVVSDVTMEELDGFDLMAYARKKHPEVGVVLITGSPSRTDALKAANHNALYLAKPIGFDHLLRAVESVVPAHRVDSEAAF